MPKLLYSVKDNKAGIFLPIFVSANDVCASRELQSTMRNPDIQISFYPEDFDLYYMGYIDDNTGKIVQAQNEPRFILGAISLKKLGEKQDAMQTKENNETRAGSGMQHKHDNAESIGKGNVA